MIFGGRSMKKIIIEDDDRKILGKWRVEEIDDFQPIFDKLKIKHDKIKYHED